MTLRSSILPVPAEFALARLDLAPGAARYGHEHGYLSDKGFVSVLAAAWARGQALSDVEQEIASLFDHELWAIPEILSREPTARDDGGTADAESVWLYLLLAWLYESRGAVSDPLAEVERIYEEFEHPARIGHLIRYMPVASGEAVGEGAMYRKWSEFLEGEAKRLRSVMGSHE